MSALICVLIFAVLCAVAYVRDARYDKRRLLEVLARRDAEIAELRASRRNVVPLHGPAAKFGKRGPVA